LNETIQKFFQLHEQGREDENSADPSKSQFVKNKTVNVVSRAKLEEARKKDHSQQKTGERKKHRPVIPGGRRLP